MVPRVSIDDPIVGSFIAASASMEFGNGMTFDFDANQLAIGIQRVEGGNPPVQIFAFALLTDAVNLFDAVGYSESGTSLPLFDPNELQTIPHSNSFTEVVNNAQLFSAINANNETLTIGLLELPGSIQVSAIPEPSTAYLILTIALAIFAKPPRRSRRDLCLRGISPSP